MASNTISGTDTHSFEHELTLGKLAKAILTPLASLKLTIVLFALSIILVFVGTLAQHYMDIWAVVDQYFRAWVARVEWQAFYPPAFFPSRPQVEGGFYFPGGKTIGLLMAVNLLAAHGLRFKAQARGTRLWAGLGVIAAGLAMTWAVIVSGSNKEGIQDTTLVSYSVLWEFFRASLAAIVVASVAGVVMLPRTRILERALLATLAVSVGGLVAWLLYQGDAARLSDPSMRILWQLTKGALAGVLMLGGCIVVFKKRAGVVLLHAGIGLMMISELTVSYSAVETQMPIEEGQTVNFVQDIRTLELALIDTSDPDKDDVLVIPEWMLSKPGLIQDAELPVDIEVVQFVKNSSLRRLKPGEKNLADQGVGLDWIVDEVRPGSGTDTNSAVDMSAAYVKFIDKKGGKPLGTHLLGLFLTAQDIPERITAGDKTYDAYLRFKRTYKPYSMRLIDVRKVDYIGTSTPRDYSSDVQLVDAGRKIDHEVKIWMNNPLRFAGETFYQSSYHLNPTNGIETTTLQVVTNTGWMIPYVSCMLVAVGMLAHFSTVLIRFLNRQALPPASPVPLSHPLKTSGVKIPKARPAGQRSDRATAVASTTPGPTTDGEMPVGKSPRPLAATLLPVLIVVFFALYLGSKARAPKSPEGEMNIHQAGKLPLVYQGRVKPLDTLARNSLRIISNKETFIDSEDKTQPAIRWLLDVISGSDDAEKHRVFRIENLEVLDTLGLKRRAGYLYAVEEFRDKIGEFEKQAALAHAVEERSLSVFQGKVLELENRIRAYTLLLASFRPSLPPFPSEEEFKKDPQQAVARVKRIKQIIVEAPKQLAAMHPPLAVPIKLAGKDGAAETNDWQPYSSAWLKGYIQANFLGEKLDPALASWNTMLVSYADKDVKTFNAALAEYQAELAKNPPESVNITKVNREVFFNHFDPFYYANVLYVAAFVLASLAWLGWNRPLNWASFSLICLTLALHTIALGARIYISGRPPVTNLYSSAIFIGWGAVILGVVLEIIFRIGVGNVIAAVSGFATLLIAKFLAGDGDTLIVLQAVLDTQFWLATHVTCITLGYATTYVAGLLGVFYIVGGVATPALTPSVRQDLGRMIYGILCFAIFFSFVGTVLGGLWADDSWGRFWGWDPKENGALIIVLWNALVLHARWDGMVKDRGMAVLAVAGNITTSWSWFGVNELQVGLHSYGFTEGVLARLAIFCVLQLFLIGLGSLPKDFWWSFRRHAKD